MSNLALSLVLQHLQSGNRIPGMNTFNRHNAINKLRRTLNAPQLNFRSVNGNPSPLDIIIINRLKNAYRSYISNIIIVHPKDSRILSWIRFNIKIGDKESKALIAVHRRTNYNTIKFNPTFSYTFVTNGEQYVAWGERIRALMKPIGGRPGGSERNHVNFSSILNRW